MKKKVAQKKTIKRTSKKVVVDETLNVKLRNIYLESRVKELETALAGYNEFKSLIDINIADPEPKDSKERKVYVGEVARSHHDIYKPKLLHMIHSSHVLLESESNTALQDHALKGAIYAFREIIRWGDLLTSENTANTTGDDASKAEDKSKE